MRTQSTERVIAVLGIIIAAPTIVIVAVLFIVFRDPDVNWITTTVELGIGAFIAALIYILQEKTSGSLTNLVKKIDRYDEEQKRLQTTVRLRSLKLIEDYLSKAKEVIEFDKGVITVSNDNDRLGIVESLERPNDRQFDIRYHIVDQLEKEYTLVSEREVRTELVENLRSVIDKMKLLYGLYGNFSQGNILQNWLTSSELALSLIGKTMGVIHEIRNEEDNKASSA
jgi:hypothetical protein